MADEDDDAVNFPYPPFVGGGLQRLMSADARNSQVNALAGPIGPALRSRRCESLPCRDLCGGVVVRAEQSSTPGVGDGFGPVRGAHSRKKAGQAGLDPGLADAPAGPPILCVPGPAGQQLKRRPFARGDVQHHDSSFLTTRRTEDPQIDILAACRSQIRLEMPEAARAFTVRGSSSTRVSREGWSAGKEGGCARLLHSGAIRGAPARGGSRP